jgi:hypothetical protein
MNNFIKAILQRPMRPFSFSKKITKRIPGNLAKRIRRGRRLNVPSGYTIARPSTREFRRIVAVNKGIIHSHSPSYGSVGHLKWLGKIIRKGILQNVKAEMARPVPRYGNAIGKTPPNEIDRLAHTV